MVTTLTREEAIAMTSVPRRAEYEYHGKCLICEHRPARNGYACPICNQQIEKETRRREMAKADDKPLLYATWRGMSVGFVMQGSITATTFKAIRVNKVPSRGTINLDGYCQGYTRGQVRKMKSAIIALNR